MGFYSTSKLQPTERKVYVSSMARGGLFRRLAAIFSESANWWLSPRPIPSFVQRYSVQRDLYQRALELTNRTWGNLWDWETKEGVRALGAMSGLPTPELYVRPTPILEMDFDSLPEVFVIKPVIGSSKKGVYVLQRHGSHFRDLLRSKEITTAARVKREISALAAEGIVGEAVIAEQALVNGDQIAYDWKVYAFQGEAALIWQVWRSDGGRQSSYYDGQWRRLGDVRRGKESHDSLPQPTLPVDLLEAARDVSRLLPVPFARIDLYEHGGRVYLGEVTPMPGSGQRFKRHIDRAMGEAWEEAESRLLSRSAGMITQGGPLNG